jgi:predicted SprT family Zn-dependent metalloprotease
MTEYERQKLTWVAPELKRRIEDVVLECIEKAEGKFGADGRIKIPEIRFNTTGIAAGLASWNNGNPYIDINPILLNENVEEVVNQTVPTS